MTKPKSVDDYLASQTSWLPELTRLREILVSTELEETIKWNFPCYVFQGKNVVGLSGFQSYFGLWFFQGSLLNDDAGVLVNAQAGKTKGMRQWRMTTGKEIKVRLIKCYVKEACQLVEAGKQIQPSRNKPVLIPPLLEQALDQDQSVKASFQKLSKSCQREYADYVSEAKREDTKRRRIAKILPMIAKSQGLNDKYR